MSETEKVNNKSNNGGRREGAGRKPGVPNKISSTVKDNVISVFEELGGIGNMALWARDNQSQFYNLYAKLLPMSTEVKVTGLVSEILALNESRAGSD